MIEFQLRSAIKNEGFQDALDVSDAMDKLYNYPDDVIELIFSDFKLSLPIVHVFSSVFEDFLTIIKDVKTEKNGEGVYGFSQNDVFDADWKLKWNEEELEITFQWRHLTKERIIGTPKKSVIITRNEFIRQYKILFGQICQDLKGIRFEHDDELIEMKNIITKKNI